MHSLTYDGFGINYGPGSQHLGERIATFTNTEGSPVYRGNDDTWRERQRLGRLFEASPEMLEALNGCLPLLEREFEDHGTANTRNFERVCLEQARAAIAKATGGKPEAAPASPATTTPDRLTDALEALQECVDLLRNSNVRFKICDGGRGNLGEASSYHRAMNKAHKVLRPKH